MSTDLTPEQVLEDYRHKLKKLETVQEIHGRQWDSKLERGADWQKPAITQQRDEWKAKSGREIATIKFLISNTEERIAERAEEKRKAARAELEEKKAQAQQSWLDNGGTQSAFDLAWPEMEREILMKDTMEVLDESNPKKKNLPPL